MARSVLVDNGGWRVKASTGAGLAPEVVVSNSTAKLKGHLGLLVADDVDRVIRTQQLSFRRAAERGYITDWHAEYEIWRRLFSDAHLRAHPASSFLYLTEAPFTPQPLASLALEMVFEEFGFRCLVKAPAAAFAAYRYGLETPSRARCCLVVDSGFSFTHVVPYYQDHCLLDGVRRVDVGGKLLTNYLKELVSYRQYNMMDEFMLLNDVKEKCCYVAKDFDGELRRTRETEAGAETIERLYLLPDFQSRMKGHLLPAGTVPADESAQTLKVENERFSVPEVLFHPSDVGIKQGGLAEAIHSSVEALPWPLREHMYSNIIVIGGNAKFPGLLHRLHADLRTLVRDDFAVKLRIPEDPENYAFGGMAKASEVGGAHFPIITKEEYMEAK